MTFSTRLDAIEREAIGLVARVAPWLAPVPTAWLVYDRTQVHLGWPWQIAGVAALTLECLGLSASYTSLQAHHFNKAVKYKNEPAARTWLAGGLLTVYLIVAEFLTVTLDLLSLPASRIKAAHFAPALLPFLSLAGVLLLAERANLAQRLAGHWRAVADNSKARQEAKQRKAQAKQEQEDERQEQVDALQVQEDERQEQEDERRRKALANLGKERDTLALYSANPALSQRKAGQALGLSRQAIGQHLAKLEAAGLIDRSSGRVAVLVELED